MVCHITILARSRQAEIYHIGAVTTGESCHNRAVEQVSKNRIREQRERRQWSQESLAIAAGTTAQTISRLENGKRGLNDKWLERLSAALGLTKADLLANAHTVPGRRPRASEIEAFLLAFWRSLSPRDQSYVLGVINLLADLVTESEAGRSPRPLPGIRDAQNLRSPGATMVERMLLDFWRSLQPMDQKFVLDIVNLWQDRTLSVRQSRKS